MFDFDITEDKLLLTGVTITGLSEAEIGNVAGLDTLVDLSSGDQVVLYEVSAITDPASLL